MIEDGGIFYKEVKPKSNFMNFEIGLYNSNDQLVTPNSIKRNIPIKVVVLFENKIRVPNPNGLKMKYV